MYKISPNIIIWDKLICCRDGYLTKSEIKRTSKNITDGQIEAVFDKYDRNKDGKLDFFEFKSLMEANKK